MKCLHLLGTHLPQTVNLNIGLLILLSAVGSAAGNLLLIESNRRLPANVVAPLIYTQLIFATSYGIIVFKQWPDAWGGIGLVVVITSGLAAFFLAKNNA